MFNREVDDALERQRGDVAAATEWLEQRAKFDDHNLQAQVAELGLVSRVTFAGYVPQDQLGTYYSSADLFVLASDFDNSPNVVLEAMSCSMPVVATRVGGVADYVTAPGGELVERGDAAAMAHARRARGRRQFCGRTEASGSVEPQTSAPWFSNSMCHLSPSALAMWRVPSGVVSSYSFL